MTVILKQSRNTIKKRSGPFSCCFKIVYHLNGQTGRSTIWANGTQNSLLLFGTGKFCPGMAFTISTNQSRLPKNDREGLKLVSKMTLEKWNTTFRLAYSVRKNRTTFSNFLKFTLEQPKSRGPFTFQTSFPETVCKC